MYFARGTAFAAGLIAITLPLAARADEAPAGDAGAPPAPATTAPATASTTPPADPPPATVAPPPPAVPPPATKTDPIFQFVTLHDLLDRNVITEAEYRAAVRDIAPSTGDRAEGAGTFVIGKWSTTLYGFLRSDLILDSTQSFLDLAGNTQVERPEGFPPPPPAVQSTYRGDHGRLQWSVRGTRFGLRFRAPEIGHVRVAGQVEMDFMGFQPAIAYPQQAAGVTAGNQPTNQTAPTEAGFFTSPIPRLRHAYVSVETPIVDILVGQYWHVMGMQPNYQPNSAQIQGLPAQIYGRTPQLRISKSIDTGPVTIDMALAALRPVQRDSMTPEGAAGLRVSIDEWRGMHTAGAVSTQLVPASIAVSGSIRDYRVPSFEQIPTDTVHLTTGAVAANAFLPIIPATKTRRGNALSVLGEFAWSQGAADLYTSLNGGMAFPTLPNTTGLNPPPAYPQNVDNGLVVYDITNFDLHPIQWTTFWVGLEYYLPGLDGKLWISGNYSHSYSTNIDSYVRQGDTPPNPNDYSYVPAAQVRKFEDFFDVNLFFAPVPAARFGLEYAHFDDRYADGVHAINHRAVFSSFLVF
jgi:hypothetical protein